MSATVEKALQLIEALAASPVAMGVSQLGRELKLNRSTVHRLLETLCQAGYARQDPDSGRYMLTPRMWELGIGVIQRLELREVARPLMEAVASETGEATLLAIMEGQEALIVDKVASNQTLQIFSPLGSRVPLFCSSIGKSLLAFQAPEFIDEITRTMTPRTDRSPPTRRALLAELDQVRRTECADSIDEWQVGVAGVAAVVRDHTNAVVGSFGITGPSSRLTPDRVGELCITAKRAAGQISKLLGYRGLSVTPVPPAAPPRRRQPRPARQAAPSAD